VDLVIASLDQLLLILQTLFAFTKQVVNRTEPSPSVSGTWFSCHLAGNTEGGSITVPLTSCLTSLD
jgi:hypothetical protein